MVVLTLPNKEISVIKNKWNETKVEHLDIVGKKTVAYQVYHYRSGFSRLDNVCFVVQGHMDKDTCKYLQMGVGFHPNGYGFYKHVVTKKNDGTVYTYWECSNSCD